EQRGTATSILLWRSAGLRRSCVRCSPNGYLRGTHARLDMVTKDIAEEITGVGSVGHQLRIRSTRSLPTSCRCTFQQNSGAAVALQTSSERFAGAAIRGQLDAQTSKGPLPPGTGRVAGYFDADQRRQTAGACPFGVEYAIRPGIAERQLQIVAYQRKILPTRTHQMIAASTDDGAIGSGLSHRIGYVI